MVILWVAYLIDNILTVLICYNCFRFRCPSSINRCVNTRTTVARTAKQQWPVIRDHSAWPVQRRWRLPTISRRRTPLSPSQRHLRPATHRRPRAVATASRPAACTPTAATTRRPQCRFHRLRRRCSCHRPRPRPRCHRRTTNNGAGPVMQTCRLWTRWWSGTRVVRGPRPGCLRTRAQGPRTCRSARSRNRGAPETGPGRCPAGGRCHITSHRHLLPRWRPVTTSWRRHTITSTSSRRTISSSSSNRTRTTTSSTSGSGRHRITALAALAAPKCRPSGRETIRPYQRITTASGCSSSINNSRTGNNNNNRPHVHFFIFILLL